MTLATEPDVPYIEIVEGSFAGNSSEVLAARDAGWYCTTNYGLAILRHDAVGELLKDRRLRQGSYAWPHLNGITEGLIPDWWSLTLLSHEGEEHQRLRKLVNPIFSRRAMAALSPRFEALADELIDGFVARGCCEFIADFAEPYTARVVCMVLGIDEEEWPAIGQWAADIGLFFNPDIAEHRTTIETALANLYKRVDGYIAERRREPRDDAITKLVLSQSEQKLLSGEELRAMVAILIQAGMDTTRNQLALGMQLFARHPDQWALLAANPGLAANAVEEVLRFNPTVPWVTRGVTEDIKYRGVLIPKGTTLHLLSYPANTDPLAIGDASFDVRVERQPHFGFGGGAHHCVGHFLARIDMGVAFPRLASRLANLRILGEPVTRVTGIDAIEVAFDTPSNRPRTSHGAPL